MSVSWSGVNGSVKGTIHYIKEYTAFDTANNSGNFFPLTLDKSYLTKNVTVKRTSNGGGNEKTVTGDVDWVLKLTDGKDTVFKFSCEGKDIAILSFSGATLDTDGG